MSNIRSLGDLKGDKPESGNSSDEDEGRQGFFVGGSERSGQQVLGPNGGDQLADRVFKSAQRHGAETLSTEEAERFRDGASDPNSGVRLSGGPSAQMNTERVHVIFWQNGFSVDDGHLRSFADPASMEFIKALDRGQIPTELQQKHRYKQVDLHLERRATEYVKPNAKPFASSGHRLGAVVPEIVSGETSQAKPSADEAKKLFEEAQSNVGLKEGEPTGRIQIRQPNGERLIGTFNPSHVVEDVRSFIVSALPEWAFQPFQLYTTFPNKLIEDESKTVKEADILNAVVVIKPMPGGIKEALGLDKFAKALKIVKDAGGIRGAIKQRYLMDQSKTGDLIGTDKFGNKYFQDDGNFMPRNRWVVFDEKQWLDYDATQVPPEWHRWLHHMTDEPPTVKPPVDRKWIMEHKENTSIYMDEKYIPYSTTRPKVQGWQPKNKQ
ncbi:unnamed protein product [Bursaphelenchus okinawaensis]|uniref:NADH dehydrogenase [ubiquinone] 1 alpha subcomplex subunit 12 n=1 Tax=Bursaphelenchus okinawaensis TaxID=465554 RepID=A0A811KU24_9BILA|nr:unnamed protein product [Bursaphelenchus okinawaensis]CAG9112329.1 unnamed protein product [Bursaphelenchus okinawaensis]